MYWFVKYILLGPFIRIFYRPWIKGLANIPSEGPAILASNHLSFSDSFYLPTLISRPIVFFAKSDYFYAPGLKGHMVAKFFTLMKQIPVDRQGGEAVAESFDSAQKVLRQGGLFGIYPEGTRSSDGKLHRGKTGVARIALSARVPVIPVAMINSGKAQPIGQFFPRRRPRVGIIIGKPLDLSQYYGMAHDTKVLRHVTDKIMHEIARYSEQEYIDQYSKPATKRLSAQEQIIRKTR